MAPDTEMQIAGRSTGLIVDWGGVLTIPVQRSFDLWLQAEGVSQEGFRNVMSTMHNRPGSALHEVETGRIAGAAFESALSAQLEEHTGVAVDPVGLLDRMFAGALPNGPMRGLVTRARQRGWRTAVLSNAWGMDYDELDLLTVVEYVLLSDRLGTRKPEAAAYLAASTALGVPPTQCVFVDDLRRNVNAAAALGMTAFLYSPGREVEIEAELLARESRS